MGVALKRVFSTSAALALTALCLLAFTASASAADIYCGKPSASRAVIIIHGGGYVVGSPEATRDTCEAFGRAGYRAINTAYPLGDLRGADRHFTELARKTKAKHRKVFAYGESAGGGLSALLAARAQVDAAYAWAPVSDLMRWQAESEPGFVNWSVFRHKDQATFMQLSAVTWVSRHSRPLLVVHGRSDTLVPFAQSRRLKARYEAMRLREVSGGHLPHEPSFQNATRTALRWLNRR